MSSDRIRLTDELAALRATVARLEQDKSDLEIELQAAIEHGDAIEAELAFANDQMRSEIVERMRAEARLKKLLEALREQKEDLELIIQTITEHSDDIDVERELANQQLRLENERIRLAKEHAEHLARIKAEFIAVVSHEVRTPMNGMLGMARLLLDTKLTPEQRDLAETVVSSGRLLLNILNDILDLSKLEAGGLQLESIDFNLVQLVEESLELMAPRAAERGLGLAHHIAPALPAVVSGDPTRLRQVLLNLVGNAVKFTEKGSVTLTMAPEPDGRVLVRVSDTGIGIAEDARARLFQRYSQADAWVSRKFGGTGLGLSICKQVVGLMGGDIGVDAAPGGGSAFWFRIPLTPALDPGARARPKNPPARVLLAEPDTAVRGVLAARLAGWGIPVVEVECPSALPHSRPGDVLIASYRRVRGAAPPAAGPALPTIRMCLAGTLPPPGGDRDVVSLAEPLAEAGLAEALDWLALPAARRPAPPGAAGIDPVRGAARAAAALDVLLVEDNSVNRRVAQGMLTRWGHRVTAVEDGAQAVAAVTGRPFDVVLMDRHMPVMDGLAAARAIRQLDGPAAAIPIVALTAAVTPDEIQECLAAGMDDFVPKPFSPEGMQAVLARVVAKSGSADRDFDPGMVALLRDVLGEDSLEEIVPAFFASSNELLAELNKAATFRDTATLAYCAHSLRSAAGQVGLLELQRLCAELEGAVGEGRIEDALALAERLPEVYARAQARLKG